MSPLIDGGHARLESDVIEFLTARDFLTASATYHEVFEDGIAEMLKWRQSAAAVFVRHRADRIAVHKSLPLEFEWDAKCSYHANDSFWKRGMIFLDLVPYAYARNLLELGISTLYCCRERKSGLDVGFWSHEVQDGLIDTINIPPRWLGPERDYYEYLVRTMFPSCEPASFRTGGSNDPYIKLVMPEELPERDWREVIEKTVAQSVEAGPRGVAGASSGRLF